MRGALRLRSGFGLAEVIVALVVFAVGALGAAALTAHAARLATEAARREAALRRVVTLLDSLVVAPAPGSGVGADVHAEYTWSSVEDSALRTIHVSAIIRASPDTIRLSARRPVTPPLLRAAQ